MDRLLLHCVVGAPITGFLVTRKSERWKNIALVAAVVFVVALGWMETYKETANLYDMLGIPVGSDQRVVYQAWRRHSQMYHPDKNSSPEAQEFYYYLKKAYETLSNNVLKSNYNRFGDYNDGHVTDETSQTIVMLSFVSYLLLFSVGCLLTLAKPIQFARQIFLVYVVAAFCLELNLRFVEDDGSIPMLQHLLPFEKILLMRQMFPSVMCAAMILSSFLYVDQDSINQQLYTGVVQSNVRIFNCVSTLSMHRDKTGLFGQQRKKGAPPSTANLPAASEKGPGKIKKRTTGSVSRSDVVTGGDNRTAGTTSADNAQGGAGDGPQDSFASFSKGMNEELRGKLDTVLLKSAQAATGQNAQQGSGQPNMMQIAFWVLIFLVYWTSSK
ncbi:unnamed protein product [Vitrella brassicaformis CCMP3155]|uniref:J domain-containing protein n=2 Tax=Vitrella brassicaformis TaxID=1169539 RepID=A0A0G4EDE4_VITBC|nr:unnamed protein product [Vitrella brassicaformis CCMP3155]|mmetsp:Transcript_38263/g.95824  ORF Transcript_38263/g.95824 Transcript_38263/m.95824 type:complete len:384 (+) Transcript_38263:114-1265(+)|eukprot:CEL94018.1 unnamed protein product [Vitrella brassicaformis CCMP3155]